MEILNKKAIGTIGNNKIEGVVYDYTEDLKIIWIETKEDVYKLNSENVEIIEEVIEENKIKGSATVEFSKYENKNCFDEVEYRTLGIDIIVTSDTKENVELLFDIISNKLEEKSDLDINWSTCPSIYYDHIKNKWYYIEGFDIEYEHGNMTEIKKDLKKVFKQVKKEIGVK